LVCGALVALRTLWKEGGEGVQPPCLNFCREGSKKKKKRRRGKEIDQRSREAEMRGGEKGTIGKGKGKNIMERAQRELSPLSIPSKKGRWEASKKGKEMF